MSQVIERMKGYAARAMVFARGTLWPTLVWMGKTGIPTSSGILMGRLVRHVSRHIPGHIRERGGRAYAWAERSMSIEKGAAVSLVLHAVVISLAYFGLPWFTRSLEFVDIPISVEVVNVSDKTSAPPSRPTKPVKEAEAPKPEPQQQQQAKAADNQPPPPPPAKPKEEEVAIVPKPETRPKAKVQPDKKPEPEKKAPDLTKVKPPRKPKRPDDFAAVLKTLEDLKKAPPPEKKEEKKDDQKKAFEQQIADVLEKPVARGTSTDPISISEIDLVRRQIAACWNLPAGAKEAENLIVEIKVVMNRDGTVADARITDTTRMGRDPFYRAAAESALRAVLNPQCSPLKLPPEKYDRWQTMTLNFDPRELLGP